MSKQTALITGASGGFGTEFAKLFAADGYDLVLTSLAGGNLAKLGRQIEKDFKVTVHSTEMDLSKPGASKKLYNWTKNQNIHIDALVNNAGIGIYGRYGENSFDDEQETINLNVVALSELCHLYINDMVAFGGGEILNVASIAGLQAGPMYSSYFASKGYVLLFSEALHEEYADKNVVVTALCPGVSPTKFFERAGMREDSNLLQTYFMSPQQVAKAGYIGLKNHKTVVVPGLRNKFVTIGYRIFPRKVITKITKKIIQTAGQK